MSRFIPAALVLGLLAPPVSAADGASPDKALPFVDDYAKALVEARAQKLPLFIEAWAPW